MSLSDSDTDFELRPQPEPEVKAVIEKTKLSLGSKKTSRRDGNIQDKKPKSAPKDKAGKVVPKPILPTTHVMREEAGNLAREIAIFTANVMVVARRRCFVSLLRRLNNHPPHVQEAFLAWETLLQAVDENAVQEICEEITDVIDNETISTK